MYISDEVSEMKKAFDVTALRGKARLQVLFAVRVAGCGVVCFAVCVVVCVAVCYTRSSLQCVLQDVL